VLVDYAHNLEGLAQLLAVARALRTRGGGALRLLLGQAGNRDDAALADLARVVARADPNQAVIKELSAVLRGRPPGEVPARREGLRAPGLPEERLVHGGDEATAAEVLLEAAAVGDVLVMPLHTSAARDAVVARPRLEARNWIPRDTR
jgi:cyanophycin synthetase